MRLRRPLMCCALFGVAVLLTGCGRMNAFVMNDLGHRHYKAGNMAAARQYFHMAAADNPENADYVHNLATAMRKQGQQAQAEDLYRKAIDINPMHQPSYHGLASMLQEQGRGGEAKTWLAMWAETQPYLAEPHIELAWLNREMGNIGESENNLRQALQVDPSNATALAHLGQNYQDQGRSTEALAMYRRSLYQNWHQPDVQSRVARVQAPAQPRWTATPTMAAHPNHLMVQQTYSNPSAVTLLPPIPTGGTASSSQPVQLGSPITMADPAHADDRVGSLPVVEAH